VIKDTAGNAVAFGEGAGTTSQGASAVAIGLNAGTTTQGQWAVAIGNDAGQTTQGARAVAIGVIAGQTTQGGKAVAVGYGAGANTQGQWAVAVGFGAGQFTQGSNAVAIGESAGNATQGGKAVAIGYGAGETSQGSNAVAIGYRAGRTSQAANTIVLNATGVAVDGVAAQTSSFYVAPIRNATGTHGVLQYNTTTNEVTYSGSITFPDATVQTTAYTGGVTASVVRAQRTAGDSATTAGKWSFTTVSGSATAEWVADGSVAYPALGLASSPYIIVTFTGFSKLPISAYRLGVAGSSPGLTNIRLPDETITNKTSPNILTAFNPTLHKYAFVEGSTSAEDRYYEFRI